MAQPVNMGEGKVLSVLFKLGGPAMVSMFFQNLYALVDTVFVSWLGTIELAALSLAIPMLYLSLALGKGVAIGATALMSHARGSRDEKQAAGIAGAVLPLAMIILCPLCLLAFPSVNQVFFSLFGVSGEVLVQVDRFVFWLAWTFPVMGFTLICEGILLSYGDAKTPMQAMIAGNILNIALDLFLIFTCKMGIAGASLASLIGWGLSGLIMLFALKSRRLDMPGFALAGQHARIWRDILRIGLPISLSLLVMPLSTAGLNYVLAPFGAAYVGAWNLSSRMEQMLILPLYGLSCAIIPFAGFNLGSGNARRIREAMRLSILACYLILIPAALVLGLYAEPVIGLFKTSPEVLRLASHAFRLALLGSLFVPAELIMTGLAQGLKHSEYTLYINAARLMLLRLPLAFLFGRLWGGEGTYISHPVSMLVSGIASIFILRHLLNVVDKECQTSLPSGP